MGTRGLAVTLSCFLSLGAEHTDRRAAIGLDLPKNLHVTDRLTDVVAAMLDGSPTFRAQCARLRELPRLRVRVTLEPRAHGRSGPCRAECVIKRYEYGFIDATVKVRSLQQVAELVAHELEHVLEFVEGIDYGAAARQQPQAVWVVADNRYETSRAIDAGRRVAAEMSRGRSAP
jgi:hypothetical protein